MRPLLLDEKKQRTAISYKQGRGDAKFAARVLLRHALLCDKWRAKAPEAKSPDDNLLASWAVALRPHDLPCLNLLCPFPPLPSAVAAGQPLGCPRVHGCHLLHCVLETSVQKRVASSY